MPEEFKHFVPLEATSRDWNSWEVDEEYDHGNLIDTAKDPGNT